MEKSKGKENSAPVTFKIPRFTIPSKATQEIIKFANLFTQNPYERPDYYGKIMGQKIEESIPEDLQGALSNMSSAGTPGAIIVENFPVDSFIPDGQTVYERLARKGKVSEKAMLGFASLMNCMPYANPGDQGGSIPNQVAPVHGKEETPTGQGQEPLDWHVETPYLKSQEVPKFLMLVCLEGDPEAKTSYFFPQKMISELPAWVITEAQKPVFHIHSSTAFEKPTEGVFPLIESVSDRSQLRLFEGNLAKERISVIYPEINARATQALEYILNQFRTIRADPEREKSGEYGAVSLKKGEALIINNGWGYKAITGVMHGRTGRIANFSRWLQRMFLLEPTAEYAGKAAAGLKEALEAQPQAKTEVLPRLRLISTDAQPSAAKTGFLTQTAGRKKHERAEFLPPYSIKPTPAAGMTNVTPLVDRYAEREKPIPQGEPLSPQTSRRR